MKNMMKQEYKAVLLVLGYIIAAELVYITLMVKLVNNAFLTILVALAILALGSLLGFFYVKSEYKNHLAKNNRISQDEAIKYQEENTDLDNE